MSDALNPNQAAVRKLIADMEVQLAEQLKASGIVGVSSRMTIAICGAVQLAFAREADLGENDEAVVESFALAMASAIKQQARFLSHNQDVRGTARVLARLIDANLVAVFSGDPDIEHVETMIVVEQPGRA